MQTESLQRLLVFHSKVKRLCMRIGQVLKNDQTSFWLKGLMRVILTTDKMELCSVIFITYFNNTKERLCHIYSPYVFFAGTRVNVVLLGSKQKFWTKHSDRKFINKLYCNFPSCSLAILNPKFSLLRSNKSHLSYENCIHVWTLQVNML